MSFRITENNRQHQDPGAQPAADPTLTVCLSVFLGSFLMYIWAVLPWDVIVTCWKLYCTLHSIATMKIVVWWILFYLSPFAPGNCLTSRHALLTCSHFAHPLGLHQSFYLRIVRKSDSQWNGWRGGRKRGKNKAQGEAWGIDSGDAAADSRCLALLCPMFAW